MKKKYIRKMFANLLASAQPEFPSFEESVIIYKPNGAKKTKK